MAKSADLENWKQRLTVSHRRYAEIERKTNLFRDYYRGKQWGGEGVTDRYGDQVVDNMVFSNIRTILPRLSLRNPKIFVSPKKKPHRIKEGLFDTISASVILEIALNYYYRELKIKRETRRCLVDALLGYWGIMDLGYTLETEKLKGDKQIEINELIKKDSVFAVRRSPLNFRFDPEATDSHLNDARWIGQRWVRSMEDVKAYPKFSNTRGLKHNFIVKTNFSETSKSNISLTDPEFLSNPDLWGRVEGWDIWDKKKHQLMTIVEGHDKMLRSEKWPLELDGFPVEILYFNENPDEALPVPDLDIYLAMQDELNRVGSLALDHTRRISQRKYIARENAFTDEEKRKITHGGDGAIAETSMNPDTALVPLRDATISQDIYIARQLLKKSIREMAGISDTEALVSQKFEQATEPALISQSVQTIREDQRKTFEDFIVRIVGKMSMILQQTLGDTNIPLTQEQFDTAQKFKLSKLEKIVGENATILQPWLNLGKEDIKGEYEFDMEVGSTQPLNQDVRKRDAVQLYQLLKDNPLMKPREGTQDVLEAFEKLDVEKYLKTEEEVAQQQQTAQQAALQAEIQKDLPKRQVDLQKTQIKSQTAKEIEASKSRTTILKTALSKSGN